jgi:hypothetical protein
MSDYTICYVEDDAEFWVVLGKQMTGPFQTHAAAWRWIDRQEGEPVSKNEDTAEWISEKWLKN